MYRLIGFILVFAIFLIFIVLNLDNKSGVSLGFARFEEIPVYLSVFISFIAGMIFAFIITLCSKKKADSSGGDEPVKSGKFFGRKTKKGDYSQTDGIKGQDNLYGID